MQNEVFFGDKGIICGLFLLNLQDFDVTIKVETINWKGVLLGMIIQACRSWKSD